MTDDETKQCCDIPEGHEITNFRDLTRRDFIKYSMGTAACISFGAFSLECMAATATGPQVTGYPISSDVVTTRQRTISFDKSVKGLAPTELCQISRYKQYGYGRWTFGAPLKSELRPDIMPCGYTCPAGNNPLKLLRFFTITDIHITDKESPSQLIYLQQLNARDAQVTSIYSGVMLYTTHVLDAAIQTVNALHKQNPIDFGISLGDTCNSTQYNELRWYIDVIDGKVITPSSGAHAGGDNIDYQKPFKAAGLDTSIPWYQTIGNHDHFWIGSIPVNDTLRKSYVSDTVFAAGDVLADPRKISKPDYYMGVLDGSTPHGDIVAAGPVGKFSSPPRVVPDPDRRSLVRNEWIQEFYTSSTRPAGHGFNLVDPGKDKGFACYSFVPKSTVPLKVIVLDNTQREDDGSIDIHGHGFLDQERWAWLKKELAEGQASDQLMIIAAHIPIGVDPKYSEVEWWDNPQNAVNLQGLITELHSHPNLLMWMAGHRHLNTVKAFVGPTPEQGFWQVETSSLRDFPQQFRTFEINLNSDCSISIVTTNVDPAVKDGTSAATSRTYAIAAQQICNNDYIYQTHGKRIDPLTQSAVKAPDGSALAEPSIKPMPSGSYNGELYKKLSPRMQAKMSLLFPAPTTPGRK
jgi:metallophosphoesterase (TIGR03768 family)